MAFDINRLRQGEKIAGGAAGVLFILMFFHWFHFKIQTAFGTGISPGWSPWHEVLIWLFALVAIVATAGMVWLTASQRTVALPVSAPVIATGLGALATVLIVLKLLIAKPGVLGISASATIWGYLGLLAAIVMTVGSYLSMREQGISFSDARNQAAGAFQGGTTTAPPAARPPAAPPPGAPPPAQPVAPPPPPAQPDPPVGGSAPPPPGPPPAR